MMGSPTIHHPTGSQHGIQGNRHVIIDLLNGGSGFYYMRIDSLCTATRHRSFIFFLLVFIVLFLFTTIRLDVPLFLTVMASEIRMVSLFAFGVFDGGSPSSI